MKDELIELGKRLSPFVVGSEGNVSMRHGDGFLIKASGRSMSKLTHNGFVLCDSKGKPYSSQLHKPSMEADFHAFIYERSYYSVVAHTHPTNLLKILCNPSALSAFSNHRLFPDQVVFNDATYCVVPYATPGKDITNAIRREVDRLDGFPCVFLLQNHGIICCAHTGPQAAVMTEICEKAAEVFVGAHSLGGTINFLIPQQVQDVQLHPDEIYRRETC